MAGIGRRQLFRVISRAPGPEPQGEPAEPSPQGVTRLGDMLARQIGRVSPVRWNGQ
jgi:hypothetical protein